MGNSVRDIDLKSGRSHAPSLYGRILSDECMRHALLHPTDLSALPGDVFDTIARHGYGIADATLLASIQRRHDQAQDQPSLAESPSLLIENRGQPRTEALRKGNRGLFHRHYHS
jgi:hypothetical protein